MVDCTSHIPTVTILINLEICELCSHHLFRKWWCDRWDMWFTFKSWFNEPWGQIEPHTNPSAVKWTHVHVKHLVRRERATASDCHFPASREQRMKCFWLLFPSSLYTDEPTEPKLRLVTGRAPCWECYSAVDELVLRPFWTCDDCLCSAVVDSIQMSILFPV